jgi:hypothetical protein
VAPYIDTLGRRRGKRLSGELIALVVKAAARASRFLPRQAPNLPVLRG